MPKLFWLTLLITSFTAGLGFIPIARSQTTSDNLSQFPVASDPQVEPPVCFFTSTRGRTFDLETLCGASSVSTNNNSSPAPAEPNSNSADGGNTTSNNSPSNRPGNNAPVTNSPNQASGDADLGPLTQPAINLPNVPPSAFNPGGVAPTRESIDGNNQK